MEREYVPLLAEFVDMATEFDCKASIKAPATAVPSLARVMAPVIVPAPTVKATPLLGSAPTVTTTGPVAALVGTVATILVLFQFVGVATIPLKVRVLGPCEDPK